VTRRPNLTWIIAFHAAHRLGTESGTASGFCAVHASWLEANISNWRRCPWVIRARASERLPHKAAFVWQYYVFRALSFKLSWLATGPFAASALLLGPRCLFAPPELASSLWHTMLGVMLNVCLRTFCCTSWKRLHTPRWIWPRTGFSRWQTLHIRASTLWSRLARDYTDTERGHCLAFTHHSVFVTSRFYLQSVNHAQENCPHANTTLTRNRAIDSALSVTRTSSNNDGTIDSEKKPSTSLQNLCKVNRAKD